MLMRTLITLAAVLALGSSQGWADGHKIHRHHHRAYIVQDDPEIAARSSNGGRLVLHPASNIACDTKYRSTRAIPCDQPVWVYGSPCEVDLGLGRYRSCD
jgi:hypothetical protein